MQIVMKLYIIAGEKSGDIHGALLLKNLLCLMPGMEVAGLGGQGMHALCPGVEDWADEAAVIGVVEVLKNTDGSEGVFSPFWKGYGRTSRIALF